MIAANHPHMGSSSGGDWGVFTVRSRITPSPVIPRVVPPPPPPPPPVSAAPAPAPTPSEIQISPPQVTSRITAPIYTVDNTPTPSPAVPASAAATATASVTPPAATTDTSSGFSSFLDWLTEETYFSGVPNGALLAGGVIVVSWMSGGKKGRR